MAKKKEVIEAINENIISDTLDELMGDKFALYAKDVIQDRAIPDARDGLKPVQRRIIYDMWNTGNTIEKPTKKCAHIVGDVMGKYHPHGDSSIYEALVHMSQPWAYRYPLVDFQGNNGSIDGDGPAAYRYTEARLSALANELVADIDKDTVDMELTFDDTLFEPAVLPSRFPNLLCNGSEGIAVGIATSIPPHNLREVSNAIIYRIKHPNCTVEALLEILPAPDFPTGGIVYESESLKDIYRTGRGKVVVSSRCKIVEEKGNKQIIVTEIPYRVNKSELIKSIDKIRHSKTIPGIEEVRDETDKEGLRIAIDLKADAKPEAILAYLLSKTSLKSSYSAHLVAIVDDRPKTMDLISYCDCYIQHQLDVITRRSSYLLKKNSDRLHIVEGLIKAIGMLDRIVEIIRASLDKADSKKNISTEFGFSDAQAEAIVMMPLYKLSHTDMDVLLKERDALAKDIDYLNTLLSDQNKRESVICDDLKRVMKLYGDDRKTEIAPEEGATTEINKRDLIAKETVRLVATRDGYLKRSSIKSWKGSGGGNGAKAGIKAGDQFIYDGECETTDFFLLFTNRGNYMSLAVNEIKDNRWNEEGFHVSHIVSLPSGEKMVKGIVIKHFRSDLYLIMLSKKNYIKRVRLSDFEVVRRSKAIGAMRLAPDDELIDVTVTSGNSNLFIASKDGRAVFYNENELFISNPRTGGLKAGSFQGKELAGLLAFNPDAGNEKILFVTNQGGTRVFSLSNISLSKRLDKVSTVFSMFKKEPHAVIYLTKASNKEPPYTLEAILDDDTRIDVTFPDFYLTPMDKYIKRPTNFSSKRSIVAISRDDSLIIDESFKAYEPQFPPKLGEKPISSDIYETLSQAHTNFEQISLFDDIMSEDEDEKGNNE